MNVCTLSPLSQQAEKASGGLPTCGLLDDPIEA